MKLYKDDATANCHKDQLEAMVNAGWSRKKPVAKAEDVKEEAVEEEVLEDEEEPLEEEPAKSTSKKKKRKK